LSAPQENIAKNFIRLGAVFRGEEKKITELEKVECGVKRL